MAASWFLCLDQVRVCTRPKSTFRLHAAVETEQALAIAAQVEVDNAPRHMEELVHNCADIVLRDRNAVRSPIQDVQPGLSKAVAHVPAETR